MASSESVDDNNQACQLQGRRRRPRLEEATVLGIVAPRNSASEEEQIRPTMASPLATFIQHTLKNVNEELPKRTLIVSDNPRMHGDHFGKEQPITLPVLDDYVALEDFMTNLLQDLQIAPSDTIILDDEACSSIPQDVTQAYLNESFSCEEIFFDIETEDGELMQHRSIRVDTPSSSATFESFSALDPEEAAQLHVVENATAILQQDARSSDFVDTNTSQHENLEKGDDQELSAEDFTIFAELSTSSVSIFQQSLHTIHGPDEELCPGKEISPTGVMDHALLLPASPILQKIKDELFDLEQSERDIVFAQV
jgi:hypothetical protein